MVTQEAGTHITGIFQDPLPGLKDHFYFNIQGYSQSTHSVSEGNPDPPQVPLNFSNVTWSLAAALLSACPYVTPGLENYCTHVIFLQVLFT